MIQPQPACGRCAALAKDNALLQREAQSLREQRDHFRLRAEMFEECSLAYVRADEMRHQVQQGRVKDLALFEMLLVEAKDKFLSAYAIPKVVSS